MGARINKNHVQRIPMGSAAIKTTLAVFLNSEMESDKLWTTEKISRLVKGSGHFSLYTVTSVIAPLGLLMEILNVADACC
jgi:hypothetical protein